MDGDNRKYQNKEYAAKVKEEINDYIVWKSDTEDVKTKKYAQREELRDKLTKIVKSIGAESRYDDRYVFFQSTYYFSTPMIKIHMDLSKTLLRKQREPELDANAQEWLDTARGYRDYAIQQAKKHGFTESKLNESTKNCWEDWYKALSKRARYDDNIDAMQDAIDAIDNIHEDVGAFKNMSDDDKVKLNDALDVLAGASDYELYQTFEDMCDYFGFNEE